jgi:raffinose/stachyose/melibiose transport system substrate-binding protein
MKTNMKKMLVVLVAVVMVLGLAACGGSGSGNSGSSSKGDGSSITVFNSKMEIQDQFVELAKQYTEETGVAVEVYYSQDTVAAHLATKYASKDPYTINMVDPKDIYSLGVQYGADLSACAWVQDTDQAIDVDGKVLGMPSCVEARGLIYNGEAIKKITGKDFDPASIETLDDFKALLEELKKGGMETPTAIMKEDWSLAAHYLAQVYEERQDPDAFAEELKAGNVDLIKDEKFNMLMDTFDVLKENNMFKSGAISVEREQVEQALSEGQVAFMFGGNWDGVQIVQYDYTGGAGMMPIPQNPTDDYTGMLVGGGSKYFYVDASEYTTEEDQKAAMDFLQWLVESDAGKTFVSETTGMVSPFKSNDVTCSDDLGAAVKGYADEGKLVPNFNGCPDDHYSVLGAEMQKYLADQCTREDLAKAVEEYWKAQA